jgi:hypothetical protein
MGTYVVNRLEVHSMWPNLPPLRGASVEEEEKVHTHVCPS